jgi:O-succinylbenzoic acid--CoA ligase
VASRELRVVDASDVDAVMTALRAALNGGAALLPKDLLAVRGGSAEEVAQIPRVLHSVAVVIETSGSSGPPKRVALSSSALLASGDAAQEALGGPGQWLLALPLTYIAGISVLVRSIMSGIAPVVLPRGHFDAQAFAEHVDTMDSARRYTSLVPLQLARLVEYAEDEVSSGNAVDLSARATIGKLDALLIGGQALEPALASRARALGWNVVATYGSSETAGGCVYEGTALSGVTVKIGDPVTREVWVSGPVLAEAYLENGPLTSDRFVTENAIRWYRTGDAGVISQGVLALTGRLDRVIISGGLKISLDAVEAAARSVEGCETVVAVSIPNSEWGQCPALIVPGFVASAERDALDDRLYDGVVAHLGRAAAPRVIHHVAALPRLLNGKIDLVALAQIMQNLGE